MSTRIRVSIALVLLASLALTWGLGLLPVSMDRAWAVLFAVALAVLGAFVAWDRRGRAGKPLLFLFSLSGTLVVVEIILRMAAGNMVYFRPEERFFTRIPSMPLIYRYKPNVSFSESTYGDLAAMSAREAYRETRSMVFTTDAFGFRNPPGCATQIQDVILLGDSFGVGTGTTDESTWAALLRSKYGLKVYNLSVLGSPWQGLINLMHEAPRLRIRPGGIVLLAVFAGNDLDDLYGPYGDISDTPWWTVMQNISTALTVFRNKCVLRQLFVQRLTARQRLREQAEGGDTEVIMARKTPAGLPVLFHTPYVRRAQRTTDNIRAHKNFDYFHNTVQRLNTYCLEHGWKLAVVLIPTKSEAYPWLIDGGEPMDRALAPSGLSNVLGELCAENRIPYLDLKPVLAREAAQAFERDQTLLWWRDDTHWNPAGHAVAADAAYEELIRPRLPAAE